MKKNLSLVFALAMLILISSLSVVAQTKKPVPLKKAVETVEPEKRPVTVSLKEGEPIKGTFVNSSPIGIQVLIAGNTLTLKWSEISQIIFTDVVSNVTLPKTDSTNNDATESALRSLRKLAAATEVGVNFQEYGRRLIDAKAEVAEVLPKINDGYLKDEIRVAMDAYADAGTAWNGFIQGGKACSGCPYRYVYSETGKDLLKKYSIIVTKDNEYSLEQSVVVSIIWTAAGRHTENASKATAEKK